MKKLDRRLAIEITEPALKEWIKKNPDAVYYDYEKNPIFYGGKEYYIWWKKDIGVQNPKWHIDLK